MYDLNCYIYFTIVMTHSKYFEMFHIIINMCCITVKFRIQYIV